MSSTTENGNEGAETSNPVFEVDSKSGDAPTELENQDQVFEVDSKPGESSEVRDDPIGRLGYNFYEVLCVAWIWRRGHYFKLLQQLIGAYCWSDTGSSIASAVCHFQLTMYFAARHVYECVYGYLLCGTNVL